VLKLGVDGLPGYADGKALHGELARVGLSVGHAKVHCDPLSGQADGRGEIEVMAFGDRARLMRKLDEARQVPGVLRDVTGIKVLFDDSK